MILRILLFCSCSILVSTNGGPPAISAQTYPIYQQNGYANPSANPTNDIASYLQGLTAQNQSPASNVSPSIIRQVLLNRILSNSAQTNLDPNVAGYGSGLNEYQNNQILPNLLNKYFTVPSQYLDSTNDVNKDDKINEKKNEEKLKKGKRRSLKSRRTHENKDDRKRNVKDKSDNENIKSITESSKNSRKKSRKNHARQENETKDQENTHNTTTRTRKKKNKDREQSQINPEHEEHTVENKKPKKRRRQRKHKSEPDNAENVTEENVTLKQIKEDFNLAHIYEGIIEENRVPRNSWNDGNELIKAYSKMPDTIANNFLSKLPKFDNPLLANFFTDYENFYQTLLTNTIEKNEKRANKKEKRKPKRSKKIHKRRNGQKNRNSTQERPVIQNSKETGVKVKNDTTTEKTAYISEKTHSNLNPNQMEKSLKSIETETDKNKMINSRIEDENTPQDLDINQDYLYNGYIDDYYPLFTDNVAYNANKKEIYMKMIGDNKYYYVTDRSETNKKILEDFELPERIIKDYEVNKQYETIEAESINNEIQFRTPPVLEIPDFQTRQIEKSEIKPEPVYSRKEEYHRYVGDKSIPDEKSNHRKNDKPFVETTFARSKVVKYGAYSSEEKSSEGDTKPWTDSYFKDGETTYIVAKSLDYPEVYW